MNELARKRICFICESILTFGGVQRVVSTIATALSIEYSITIISLNDNEEMDRSIYGLDKTDIDIRFFHPRKVGTCSAKLHRIASGIYRIMLPHNRLTSDFYARSSFPKSLRKQFIEVLNKGEYDTIIGVHGGLSIKLATIRKELTAKKIIGWMHNSYEAFFENSPAYYQGLESHFKYQMQKLETFVTLCNADSRRYHEKMGLNATVIYNPLTVQPGTASTHTTKRFISVGRMSPLHKGFDILIRAFAEFCKSNTEWVLDIVGEGPERKRMIELAEELGVGSRIQFHNFTKNIQSLYSNSSVYVSASRWEGFGLVLIEAASHNLPIISSELPVTKEILDSKITRFFKVEDFVELSKIMVETSQMTTEALCEWGKKSKEQAEPFSLQKIKEKWENII